MSMSGRSFQYLDTTSEPSSDDIEDDTYVRHDEFGGSSSAKSPPTPLVQSRRSSQVTTRVFSGGKLLPHQTLEFQYMFDSVMKNFRMASVEKARLVDIVKSAIKHIHKLRNSEGQPLRWCYVPALPNGKANGTCLALEIGSSEHYFQLHLCDFRSDSGASYKLLDHRAILLTREARRVHMHRFCDFVAACAKKLLLDNNVHSSSENPIYMGISAGFDVRVRTQQNPVSAIVVSSTKAFVMSGFVGRDVVSQLRTAFERADIQVQIALVANDSVGVLLAGIHEVQSQRDASSDCSIGVVCNRQGCNVACLETDRDFLDLCGDERQLVPSPRGSGYCAVLNTEVGSSIGNNGELDGHASLIEMKLKTKLMSNGQLPAGGTGIMIDHLASGSWYPYILHETINALAERRLIGVAMRSKLGTRQSECFEVFSLCDRWRGGSPGCTGGSAGLAQALRPLLGVRQLSNSDAVIIADVCQAVVNRTAEVLAATITAVAHKTYGKAFPKKMVIAYGGSMFTSVSQLSQLLEKALKSMMPSEAEVLLQKSEASFGCAVTAVSTGPRSRLRVD